MNRCFHLAFALCGCLVFMAGFRMEAADSPTPAASAPAKDAVCQTSTKPGADCHSPGTRVSVLKSFLTEQEKLAASQTATNVLKDCDKPPSKAVLMLKAAPSSK